MCLLLMVIKQGLTHSACTKFAVASSKLGNKAVQMRFMVWASLHIAARKRLPHLVLFHEVGAGVGFNLHNLQISSKLLHALNVSAPDMQ